MDDRNLDYDEVTDSSESESDSEPSSSSGEGLFKGNIPYVLELHDITRDEPAMPPGPQPTGGTTGSTDPLVGPAAAKLKKHRKKKKASDAGAKERRGSLSADSASDASSAAPSATDTKEQFYDARESFHAIPENEVLAQVTTLPETTIQDPKAPDLVAASESQSTTPVAQKQPSAIIKPTAPP